MMGSVLVAKRSAFSRFVAAPAFAAFAMLSVGLDAEQPARWALARASR
jgi:hypothetical protein